MSFSPFTRRGVACLSGVLVAGAAAVGLASPAAAAAPVVWDNQLDATVTGTSVTASTTITIDQGGTFAQVGICARNSAGADVDFPLASNVTVAPWQNYTPRVTKTFAPGTYSYFPCAQIGTGWQQIMDGNTGGAFQPKTFVVAATTAPPPATAGPDTAALSEFVYSGTWNTATGERWSSQVGATATIGVNVAAGGGTVSLQGFRDPSNRTAGVTVDGGTEKLVSQNGASQTGYTFWTSAPLAAGQHKITVRVATADVSLQGAKSTNGQFTTPGAGTTTPPPPTTPPAAGSAPLGVAGTWRNAFTDNFDTLDTNRWSRTWYGEGNGIGAGPGTAAANTTVSGGYAHLVPGQASTAVLQSDPTATPTGVTLPIGGVVEWQAFVRGPNTTNCYNWPALWATSSTVDGWPNAGEHDVMECLGGQVTDNYHSPSGSHNQGTVPGQWTNGWHTFAMKRNATSAEVYYDGKQVRTYGTDDNNRPEILVMSTGTHNPDVYGAAAELTIDWVKVWAPA